MMVFIITIILYMPNIHFEYEAKEFESMRQCQEYMNELIMDYWLTDQFHDVKASCTIVPFMDV